MTKWLWLFLAFYILVWQPALLGRMLNNNSLYELSLLNAGVFFTGWIISVLCKPSPIKLSEDSIELKRSLNSSSTKKENNKLEIKERLGTENIKDEEDETENIVNNNINDEEKTTDKPLKESINIPKIVQPISWHSSSKKKKKKSEVKWGQWLILFITLCLAGVVAWTLWEFLWSRWIAISLLLWRILYLIIGKLFDISWFYNARKLFTNWLYILLIIVWIGYWVYAAQQESSLSDLSGKISSYIKSQIGNKNNSDADTWSVIYVYEWTGEVISDTWTNTNPQNITWAIENQTWTIIKNETWTINNTWVEEKIQPVTINNEKKVIEEKTVTEEMSTQDLNKRVTIWEAVRSLLDWSKLSTKTNVTFKFVSKSNELYPYFKTAQEKQMIWTDTNPNSTISCETYITMKWLREWRNVWSYTSSTVKTVYWNKATELWKLNWCKKWTYLTKGNL